MNEISQKSTENMKNWDNLFNNQTWSDNEKQLIAKFEDPNFKPYIFRTGVSGNLCRILHSGYISKDEKEYDVFKISKKYNNTLYSASKCEFTSIGGPVMTEFYGDVLYILNDDQLQAPNVWGSTAAPGDDGGAVMGSTYFRIARQLMMDGFEESAPLTIDPKKLAAAQEIISDQIILSSDWIKFNKYFTMLSIHSLKNKDEVITSLLNENDRMKFWTLFNKSILQGDAGPIEMHYDGKIPLNDVKSITISSTIKDMLVESCPSDYETYKDKIIIDNSSKK